MKAICLNLNKRTDRWDRVQKEFESKSLVVERFAVIEDANPFRSFNISQQAILKTITEDTIVFEDDVIFVSDKLNEVLETAPEGWDMLYLGGNVLDNLKHYSGHWWRCIETHTTHAVIYTPKAAEYILQRFNPDGIIYDEFLRSDIQPKLNSYICKPFICSQRPDYSDLWQTQADYGIMHTQSKLT